MAKGNLMQHVTDWLKGNQLQRPNRSGKSGQVQRVANEGKGDKQMSVEFASGGGKTISKVNQPRPPMGTGLPGANMASPGKRVGLSSEDTFRTDRPSGTKHTPGMAPPIPREKPKQPGKAHVAKPVNVGKPKLKPPPPPSRIGATEELRSYQFKSRRARKYDK